MILDFVSDISSLLPGMGLLGIPALFWVIALVLLIVVILLVFFVFRPKKAPAMQPQAPVSQQGAGHDAYLSSFEIKDAIKNEPSLQASQQASSSSAGLSEQPSSQTPAATIAPPVQSAPVPPQPSINTIKTDNSLKALLITKFQSKIESQLSDRVEIKDINSQGENYLARIVIAGVEMVLTLDNAGKIIDYKKANAGK